MDFQILGQVAATAGGRAVALDGAKQRTVLAALLLAHGKVMPDERLTTLVWGWEPPATSTNQLYTYVSRLRTRLGADVALERVGAGYRLDIGDAPLDWDAFRRLAEAGRADLAAGRYEDAERHLAGALALWRGPALTGVTEHLAEAEGPRLEEARIAALEHHAEAALALGRHDELVPGLTRLVHRHPVRERLRCHLMTALFRSGRQADALAVYEQGRAVLAEELGIDPGPELRALHQAVLTGTVPPKQGAVRAGGPDGAQPCRPAGTAAHQPAGGTVPATLPAPPADFTGRENETAEVVAALRAGHTVVVTGAPGTGKSALALWTAAHLAGDFPDGLLHADLRTAHGTPREPAEVLGLFLGALGVGPDRLPATADERGQLYRTLLAGRRVLVVLDNAADDAQVRPLLPGAGPGRTLVTGVRASLAALEGAHLVRLGPLEPAAAVGLLAAVAGPARLAQDPEAAARIAEYCDRLPLALRIAGARLAARPHWPAARLAARLAPEDRRLGELRLGSLDVRTALRTELDRLPAPAGRAFAVLAAAGLERLDAADAAALLDTGPDEAEELLEELADAGLLEGWPLYGCAPLVRLLGRERHCAPALASF
ncbi:MULTISPECIES: BTAD domain-containing putative transcriptional regulator [Streptomyces]|uniref:OmpR/PhoB-type domain-containing protein n=1 Tax=Streptomyces luteosporeus TaxID=173856 RepID=A0ABP6G1J5_9ACTN